MYQGGKQSPPCANAVLLMWVFNKRRCYQRGLLPARAGTQIRALISVLGGKHKKALSRAVIYECGNKGTCSCPYLTGSVLFAGCQFVQHLVWSWLFGLWVFGCVGFVCLILCVCIVLFVCLFFFFPLSGKIGAGEMWWLGSAPRKRVSVGRGAELHLLVLSWVEICQVFLPVQP